MELKVSEVERIAVLARIKLSEKEKKELARDLGAILGYIDKLNEIKTEGVESTAQVTGLENVFRKDEPKEVSESRDRELIIEQFPDKKGDYLKVKAVFSDRE